VGAVLIVDDEPALPRALALSIRVRTRPDPCKVHKSDSMEGVEAVLRSEPVDVVLTDYRLGSFNGGDVLRLAKACQPQARRLIYTGFPGDIPPESLEALELFRPPLTKDDMDGLIDVVLEAVEATDLQRHPGDATSL
jgi:DNA-binding NarL/FixJ family response regulator